MNPFKLFREGSTEAVAQACEKCGRVYGLSDGFAIRCCDPRCDDCAEPARQGMTVCNSCWEKRTAAKEAERIAKATKIPLADYSGPLFIDGAWNEGYLRDKDDLTDWIDGEMADDEPIPTEAWACHVKRLHLPSADDLVEQATQDEYDGAYYDMPPTDELHKAIDAYNASVTAESWSPDYSRRVVLDVRASRSATGATE